MKSLVYDLLKLFVPKHLRWDKPRPLDIFFAKIILTYINKCMVYWTSPFVDHIPKVVVSQNCFQTSYHIKTIVPSETQFFIIFS